MRLILMFDLPMQSHQEQVAYREFSKFLKNTGFVMLQKSVYAKMVLNTSSANLVEALIKNNIPPNGNIMLMLITENQFVNIDYLVGKKQNKVIDTNERIVSI